VGYKRDMLVRMYSVILCLHLNGELNAMEVLLSQDHLRKLQENGRIFSIKKNLDSS
jgi:hypothetical protein